MLGTHPNGRSAARLCYPNGRRRPGSAHNPSTYPPQCLGRILTGGRRLGSAILTGGRRLGSAHIPPIYPPECLGRNEDNEDNLNFLKLLNQVLGGREEDKNYTEVLKFLETGNIADVYNISGSEELGGEAILNRQESKGPDDEAIGIL